MQDLDVVETTKQLIGSRPTGRGSSAVWNPSLASDLQKLQVEKSEDTRCGHRGMWSHQRGSHFSMVGTAGTETKGPDPAGERGLGDFPVYH